MQRASAFFALCYAQVAYAPGVGDIGWHLPIATNGTPMKTTAPASLLTAIALLLGSCATSRLSEEVEVSLANLRFGEATPLETTATCFIRIQNQMPQPLGVEAACIRYISTACL